MPRILILGKWPIDSSSGGVGEHIRNLIPHLIKNHSEHEIRFISFNECVEGQKDVPDNVRFLKAREIYYLLPFLALMRIALEVRKYRPDIIHIQGINISPYSLYSSFLAKGLPTIVTIHNLPSMETMAKGYSIKNRILSEINKLFERMMIRNASILISVTRRLKERIVEEYGNEIDSRIIVVPNGVDANEIHSLCKSFALDPRFIEEIHKKFVIFHAKSLNRFNGQEYLIRAMPLIIREIPNSCLILAGNGPLRAELENLSSLLGLREYVRFLGIVEHEAIPSLINLSDLIVIPSIKSPGFEEGSSIFILEAMTLGKPVIASSVGGLAETISHTKNGLLIESGNYAIIAAEVIRLHHNPSIAANLGRNAKEFVEKERSWNGIAQRTSAIYDKLNNQTESKSS